MINYKILKKDIEKKDYKKIFKLLKILEQKGKKSYAILNLIIEHTSFDRKFYQEHLICEYVKEIYDRHNNLFYFIIEDNKVKTELFYCLVGVVVSEKDKIVEILPRNKLKLKKLIKNIEENTIRYGIDIVDYERTKKAIDFLLKWK